jgi:PAS domain S-box-containing protein
MWQYRNILDAAVDGMIISDLETGCVVEANPAARQMHGYPRDEFIGMHLSAYIHPDSQNLFNLYIRAFQSGEEFDTRVIHQRQDGSTIFIEWRDTHLWHPRRMDVHAAIGFIT